MPLIQISTSQGRSIEQKREQVGVLLTRYTGRIMKMEGEKLKISIYEV
jgi:phenylpyruvate tautomerase PptA (4-oxalocrotonate tautomerase family)